MSVSNKSYKFPEVYDPIKNGSIDGTDTVPHDKALLTALYSEYVPNKQVKGDPLHTVFVAHLNPRTTQDTIQKVFSEFGHVVRIRLVKDIVTGKSRGYAFVEFDCSESANKAAHVMHKELIDNSVVLVEMEKERVVKGWKPRRLGGGFGGRKESGQLRFGGRDRPFQRPISLHEEFGNTRKEHRAYQHSK